MAAGPVACLELEPNVNTAIRTMRWTVSKVSFYLPKRLARSTGFLDRRLDLTDLTGLSTLIYSILLLANRSNEGRQCDQSNAQKNQYLGQRSQRATEDRRKQQDEAHDKAPNALGLQILKVTRSFYSFCHRPLRYS